MVHTDRSCFIQINAFHLLVLIIKLYVHSAFCFLAANYKHQSVAFLTSLHHIFKMSATFFLFFLNCWSLFIVCSDHMQCPILYIPLVNGSVFASGISIFVQFIRVFLFCFLLQFSGGVRWGVGGTNKWHTL